MQRSGGQRGSPRPAGLGMPGTGSPRLPCALLPPAPRPGVGLEVAAAPGPTRGGRGGVEEGAGGGFRGTKRLPASSGGRVVSARR